MKLMRLIQEQNKPSSKTLEEKMGKIFTKSDMIIIKH